MPKLGFESTCFDAGSGRRPQHRQVWMDRDKGGELSFTKAIMGGIIPDIFWDPA